MINVDVEWLQSIDAIKDVPKKQLQWLLDNCTQMRLEPGEEVFRHGDKIKGTYIIISGKFRLCVQQGDELREVTAFEGKSITGYLPFSRAKAINGYGEVVTTMDYLFFPVEKMEEMIRTQFELTQALVHVMTTRVRNFTAFEQQNEKMMALGKLSAGLAHELNNPAAAVVRGAASLLKHLQLTPETFKKVMNVKVTSEGVDFVSDRLFAVICREEKPQLTMMQRGNMEDDLLDWMDNYDIDNSQEIAENMVEFGFTPGDLDSFKAHIPDDSLSAVFNWINNNLVTEKMVMDIEDASRRIADLVGAVKNFTHMDQGHGKQYADIHKGILSTLTMLQHKVKYGNITVDQQFDTTLPPVNAMIGELNQVWTNLIDNALDAMEANRKGVLTIKTARDGECVQVSVIDDGPGIPEEIQSRIFDPFFTTKEVGKGTGLGLDVVTRIVQQHKGTIKLNSVPGCTEFKVEFPINGD
ncbi:GHKL domain-containing protein [Mucilaginibacter mali]|uniref:histidine kinase n=1 Tax=Mucilaginibacter mali TaxID=2740462 RepID=A0A7D4PV71_9SPHI|nr:ATP-binding protein [Mucilaginibacter mali]QKJ30783.1 GHKL domain-containing protein [Mucilaginibacter mali]